ncbi:LuxR C-terminal-related transcriptional regulator [Stenotrophobium rhamnosiphilum]|uniref:HTH luxR-type domain-containing protein n=1 Tax=Stenotrophobium rhamnosiphilum TaxID=2029166 RepID=A0A2T5MH16_9GAMM|nr:LuxR C-terminal-related transcriptional regulator [Stenotrophobium rhamnosiphilum]PTU31871.1 hypothetical protein CJD38_04075 [Stenotrophobium rhamnosiphilum]
MTPGEMPLIRTKLAPPRVSSAPVNRDSLLEQLNGARDRKLTLLLAPGGCGKTTLLTQWRRSLLLQGVNVAWYNAGVDDNELYFGSYIVESLEQAGLVIDKEALHVYLRSNGKAWLPLVASLINDIHDHEKTVYMVIDDLHHLFSFGALKFIDYWLSLAPANFHLVLSSRNRPSLKITRLQADDEVLELTFPELRFTQTETHNFLQSQKLPGLTSTQEKALHKMTDGWPAGLQILAFTLRKQKNTAQFFDLQSNRSLSKVDALEKYMETAIVEQLTDDEFNFLVRISACRRFNRALAEKLTGNPRAAEYLARFENENLFLAQIETLDAEPWYRFHRLFSEFLNKRLSRLDEAELRKIHNTASHWFAENGLHIEAIRHATDAGDTDYVVQLIDSTARRMVNSANFIQLLKRCDAVPRESLRSRLNVCLCAAWAQILCNRQEDFENSMADIAQHPDHRLPKVEMEVQLLRACNYFMVKDDTAACLSIVEPMIIEKPSVNAFNSLLLRNIVSMSLVYANKFEEAREVARLRYQIETQERPDYPRPLIDIVVGLSHLIQGNISLATASLQTYIVDALERTTYGVDAAGLFSGYLLEALYQSGDINQAREFLDRYLDLIDAVGTTDGQLFAYRVKARIQYLDGNAKGAQETLLRLEEIGYQKRLDRIVAWSLYDQILLAIREARTASINDLLTQLDRLGEKYRDARNCAWSEIRMAAVIARAMTAFSSQDSTAALAAIDAAARITQENRRLLQSTKLGFMRAITLLKSGASNEAIELGQQVLSTAAEAGMMRVLPDLGVIALPLTKQLISIATDSKSQALLLAAKNELEPAIDVAMQPENAPTHSPSERLSPRELEVLALVAKALSSKSIARALNMSVGTVKWHLKNIFGKLHAVSREDALARARKLGMIA